MFTAADRRKHLAIKKQHPKLDIRFVFENSRRKLRKGAKSTYAEWCIKYGFKYYDSIIPEDWLKEKGKNKHPKFIKFKWNQSKKEITCQHDSDIEGDDFVIRVRPFTRGDEWTGEIDISIISQDNNPLMTKATDRLCTSAR